MGCGKTFDFKGDLKSLPIYRDHIKKETKECIQVRIGSLAL